MGRYTNVQSYTDESPSMRTVSYAQATGNGRATNDNNIPFDSTSREASQVHQQPSAGSIGIDSGKGILSNDSGGDTAQLPPIKTDSTTKNNEKGKAVESQQTRERGTTASSSCVTTSVFVGGLHSRIGDLHLQKLFSPYGQIVRINIVTHNPSMNPKSDSKPNAHGKAPTSAKYMAGLQQSKGYAFVEYSSVESARLAISRLDGRMLMGKRLAVRPSLRKPNDVAGGSSGKAGADVTVEEARRAYGTVQSKIEAVKRAIEEKKKGK